MDNFLTPGAILNQLNLEKFMVAADFGCGSGGWALPLAKILSEGKVFAIDMIGGPLSALNSRAKMERILNIQTMTADVEKGTKLISSSCDLVLMTNLLFECKDKTAVLKEAKRVLKPGGKILVIDWRKAASFGPRERAVAPQDAIELAKAAGLKIEMPSPHLAGSAPASGEFDAGPYHYGLILTKE